MAGNKFEEAIIKSESHSVRMRLLRALEVKRDWRAQRKPPLSGLYNSVSRAVRKANPGTLSSFVYRFRCWLSERLQKLASKVNPRGW